jgi:hypothetical protein
MEVVKSYRIPVNAPRDLIEEYFKVKQRALEYVLSKVRLSGKAHLSFGKRERGSLETPC